MFDPRTFARRDKIGVSVEIDLPGGDAGHAKRADRRDDGAGSGYRTLDLGGATDVSRHDLHERRGDGAQAFRRSRQDANRLAACHEATGDEGTEPPTPARDEDHRAAPAFTLLLTLCNFV